MSELRKPRISLDRGQHRPLPWAHPEISEFMRMAEPSTEAVRTITERNKRNVD
jgi:hypothetical protein